MSLRKALYQHALQGIFLFQLLLFKFILTIAWQQSWQTVPSMRSARLAAVPFGSGTSQCVSGGMLSNCLRTCTLLALVDAVGWGKPGCWDVTWPLRCRRAPGQLTHVSWPGSPSQQGACPASSTACPETLPGMAGAVREVVFPLWYVSAFSISALIALRMQKVGRGTETSESQS